MSFQERIEFRGRWILSILLLILAAVLGPGIACASASRSVPTKLSTAEVADSETAKHCLKVVRALEQNYPDARIQHEILPQENFVRCRIQMDRVGHFFFSIVQPPNMDSEAYPEYNANKDEFRESLSATGSRFIPSGQTGNCYWNSTGFMAKLQLRWPAGNDSDCTIGQAPPPLQRGYELIKGEFIFP